MKLLSIAFFGTVALLGIGACERHNFKDTRALQDHGDPSHADTSHVPTGHAPTGHAPTGHAPAGEASSPAHE